MISAAWWTELRRVMSHWRKCINLALSVRYISPSPRENGARSGVHTGLNFVRQGFYIEDHDCDAMRCKLVDHHGSDTFRAAGDNCNFIWPPPRALVVCPLPDVPLLDFFFDFPRVPNTPPTAAPTIANNKSATTKSFPFLVLQNGVPGTSGSGACRLTYKRLGLKEGWGMGLASCYIRDLVTRTIVLAFSFRVGAAGSVIERWTRWWS